MSSLFHNSQISYASIQGDYFKVDGELYTVLKGGIQEFTPIRKLFEDGKLSCYSADNLQGKTGIYCSFCKKRFKCQQKVRLNMVLCAGSQQRCVVLDINSPSFPGLRELIDKVGEEQLSQCRVAMKIVYNEEDRKLLEFWEIN